MNIKLERNSSGYENYAESETKIGASARTAG